MDRKKINIVLLVLIFVMQACSPATPTEQPQLPVTVIVEPTSSSQTTPIVTEAEVPRISLEEARAAMESGAAILIDVRSKEAYDASHVAGAISIPLWTIESDPNGLNVAKDQWIITYCA